MCEAARVSRRFVLGRYATVAGAGISTNQFTQWNTVQFATVRFTVVLKCLRRIQWVQTNLLWFGLRALLIETSTFAIFATTRFASLAQSTRTPDIATPAIQRSMGAQLIGNETACDASIPEVLFRLGQGGVPLVRCQE